MPMAILQSDYFDKQFNNIINNIILWFFKFSVSNSLVIYNLVNGIIDAFVNESGVATKTNATYDAVNDLYSPTKEVKTLLDYMEYATDGAAQAAYVTNSGYEVKTGHLLGASNATLGDTGNNEYDRCITFKLISATTISSVAVWFDANAGTPSGNVTCRIETLTGTIPSGALAHANLTTTFSPTPSAKNTITFTGAGEIAAGNYAIVLLAPDQSTDNAWLIIVEYPTTYSDGDVGNSINGGAWNLIERGPKFEVYSTTKALQSYSEYTIKTQGTYALKGIAAITDSLNKTLTRTVSPTINLSGLSQIKFDMRTSRTGENLKIGIHDSGGTTTEITPNIISANEWQTITWDISGVADANKDAIDSIIVTVVNADAANTFYIDNMFGGDLIYNMTLISTTTTAVAQPTKSRIVLFEEDVDSITLNTDLKAYISRDGGTTYTQHTLVNEGNYDTSKRILASESIDISGQPAGTSIKWKVTTHNNKDLKLKSVAVNWD